MWLSIHYLCELAGVSRSGYYNYIHSVVKRNRREEEDFSLIMKAYGYRGRDKGGQKHQNAAEAPLSDQFSL